ncbi:MAG: hypothetical protein Sv326_0029 [Candidatus Fermentimicrarchaeum limneticum]|uniref:TrbC/VIRB2 family protein n=1 Tax=Fermentimicrarchaeum limneticum TaxID=2795018 RepID=A0A7D6BUD0_FERL1|nr:MAG: hypothetical protein Sv326_0029 [Candidatus Fermentimicrarchaeum limneticum]
MDRHFKYMVLLLCLSYLMLPVSATGSMATRIRDALCGFQTLVYTILPTLALIMFLFAGLAYAAGQVFGAEMRAKAQGWAMSLLVGGILGIFIAVLAPILVSIFVSMSGSMTYTPC